MLNRVITSVEPSTLVFSLAVPLCLTLLGVWLSVRRHKLQIRAVFKLGDKYFNQLAALYCERVPDYERVPPNHFRAFFRREHSAKSIRDFQRRARKATTPVHLLLIARTRGEICGFIKAIFIPKIRCLYIAYLVTAAPQHYEERSVTQELLGYLFDASRRSLIDSIVYEISATPPSKYKAKARLFRHYANALGVQVRCISAKYLQPEICSFEAGDCKLTRAELHIAYLRDRARDAWHSLARDEYKELVAAIYTNVYLMSYAVAQPELTERYRDFLQQVMKDIFASLKTPDINLK